MRAYPPTNICPGCKKPFPACQCNRLSPEVLAELARAAAHLQGAPGHSWATAIDHTGAAA
ncbi:hypothetical protein FZ103_11220 [Streptomonospora sp. PA3]|uniref:hypothetical protein n=1 Tax=Streptomonospora sp. PA3 TaxID=2607326 RepID=UPI0012DEC7DA|nr:hypothetical protein [Streptomonospora sp. PA3]MUL41737.1 hypothetical protein [Streptomonospora sp. PA3]